MKRRVRDFASLAERLWPYITIVPVVTELDVDACWEWQAGGHSSDRRRAYGRVFNEQGEVGVAAHRAMWRLISGQDVPEGLFVCHTCDNPLCCRPTHLWLGTHADNMADCQAKGRSHRPIGELHPKAKLTAEDVRAIRASNARTQHLARAYGVTPPSIHAIRIRKSWSHL